MQGFMRFHRKFLHGMQGNEAQFQPSPCSVKWGLWKMEGEVGRSGQGGPGRTSTCTPQMDQNGWCG